MFHDDVQLEKRTRAASRCAPGDWWIPLDQDKARYAIETLEPQAHDSFFRWGFFNSVLEKKEAYSDYVFEDHAMELLRDEPELKAKFDAWKGDESGAAVEPGSGAGLHLRELPALRRAGVAPVSGVFGV